MSVRKSESLGQKIIYLVDLLDEIVFQMIYNVQKVFFTKIKPKNIYRELFLCKSINQTF